MRPKTSSLCALARWIPASCLAAALLTPVAPGTRVGGDDDDDEEGPTPCESTADAIRNAALEQASSDFWLGLASCLNLEARSERNRCLRDNLRALDEALELLAAQFEARLDLCLLLGGGRYDPEIEADDFVPGVTNPFFPLPPGTTRVYEKSTPEGIERVVVTVTAETREILGVECVVVRDVVDLEGVLVEDTLDYFAQDEDGNVWYFGELAMNFEDGELVDLGGSWRAGVDGARPGIVMPAAPAVGDAYRQEFLVNEAEDAARVTALDELVSVPSGQFGNCLETLDFTPLEPEVFEAKFYAPGVGLVLEVDLESGERTELVSVF